MIAMRLEDVAGALGARVSPEIGDSFAQRVSIDSREVRRGDLFFAIRGPRFDGHEFVDEAFARGAVACVCAPTGQGRIGHTAHPAGRLLRVDDTTVALGTLAAYYRQSVLPASSVVIAVTGSNGNTTTKRMIDHVLSAALKGACSPRSYNNSIGVPLTLFNADADDRYIVVEIGTNAPGEVANLGQIAGPDVAVITSIGEAHLEGLGDIRAIAAEKASLLDSLRPNGLAVVNVDRFEIMPHLEKEIRARVVTVGANTWARHSVGQRTGTIHGSRFLLDGRFSIELPMPGTHHATNAAATFAVCRWFGLDPKQIIERLATFVSPPGRTRCLELDGITVVDDTYNANPASMMAAIDTLCCQRKGRRVLVMGDMYELGADAPDMHRKVTRAAIDAGIEVLIAVGHEVGAAAGELPIDPRGARIILCDDADVAADVLDELLTCGDTVLLKGSRNVQLDRVVRHLQERAGRKVAVA